MKKTLPILGGIIITSFYFFPFEFSFLPGINTKMALAGIGLVLLGLNLGRSRESLFRKDITIASLLAGAVSLIGFIATIYNNTTDYSYASYLISMWVWLSGAYVVILFLKWIHGCITPQLVCNYLIAVCTIQCIIAISMEFNDSLKFFVDGFLGGEGFMGKNEGRLYGIGAALDVAGSRFATMLIAIAFFCSRPDLYIQSNRQILLYLIAFFIILLIGNMMARTTIIGGVIAIAYYICNAIFRRKRGLHNYKIGWWLIGCSFLTIIVVSYLYLTNPVIEKHVRFAFEGFFSLAETGQWEVQSNNQLLHHWDAIPQEFRTWMIGDGYFQAHKTDPYYLGPVWGDFYHSTDVGYWRFIYYFGLIGLLAFSAFLCYVTYACSKNHPTFKLLCWLILITNFIIWAKVSTDLFLVFALLLVIPKEPNDTIVPQQIPVSD
ncbi:MAG: hypothetical protein IJB62_05185 [Alistipes sp.]|nr:hypothetical protein [Alistipes sp.]